MRAQAALLDVQAQVLQGTVPQPKDAPLKASPAAAAASVPSSTAAAVGDGSAALA